MDINKLYYRTKTLPSRFIHAKITQKDLTPYVVGFWTEEEKNLLHELMKKHGSTNYDAIAKDHPSKTKKEIVDAIEYYKSTGLKIYGNYLGIHGRQVEPKERPLDIGLSYWINKLAKTFDTKELFNELPTALTIIAENSDLPAPDTVNGIDFKAIYLFIADALKGECGQQLNNVSALLLKRCFTNLFYEAHKYLLSPNIDGCLEMMADPQEAVLPIKSDTKDIETRLLEVIITQLKGNPFCFKTDDLKVPIISTPSDIGTIK